MMMAMRWGWARLSVPKRQPLPWLILCILVLVFGGCSGGSPQPPGGTVATGEPGVATGVSGELVVFAASSLTDAFNEIGQVFTRANPQARVRFNFAASTALRTQLEQGARAGVYASADQTQMDLAKKAGVIGGEDRVFAKNKLVVIFPSDNPAGIITIADLAKPGLRLVLTDRNVPIGGYARTTLDQLSADPGLGSNFSQRVLANLRSEEANVRAVVTKVQLGEADAAIVYASDVTPAVAGAVRTLTIPDSFNTIATYPIAVVEDASNLEAARAFIQFVRSPAGQAVLKKWNFVIDADTGT